MFRLGRSLTCCAILFLAAAPGRAQTPAPAEAHLRLECERLYAEWKAAMTTHDLPAWARTTARVRQMMVRNTIVSQKREWPRSLFSLAMTPPEIRGLKPAGSQQLGDQLRLVYHGRIDFQLDDPRTPPDAVLVIDFLREPGGWRFFATRYFNFRDAPDEARKVAQGDLGFLQRPETALTGRAPEMPKPCPEPGYAGQIQVSSFGYTTRLQLGEFHRDLVSGRDATEIIAGGLNRGVMPLVLDVEPIADVPATERSLRISIYALTPALKTRAARVFTFHPNNPVGRHHDLRVTIGPSTMQPGNETDLIPSSQ
jgi:hypothetical protein